jgi:muconolactone delta-isomerase
MANFIALSYTEAFLKSRLASAAPSSDLKFPSLMKISARENKSAAELCVKSVLNHLWYLSEELVVFAIFENDLPSALRLDMVPRLLCILRPTRYISQKPKFPKFDPLLIDFPRQLITFLGPRSWLLFYLLELKEEQLDWMHSTSVDNWEK